MVIVSQNRESITDEMKFNIEYRMSDDFERKAKEYVKSHKELEKLSNIKFKNEIIKAIGSEGITCSINTLLNDEWISFGEYSYERAKEVLQEIAKAYRDYRTAECDGYTDVLQKTAVYEMPE